jgi:hypothetical protein
MSVWRLSWRADPLANRLAKRHYTCQSPDSKQFVPPGRCVVLRTEEADAVWVTSWPLAAYVKHAWAGAWMCSMFRNETGGRLLSSDLIREAVACTRWIWPEAPPLGMVTFVDASKTRRKRDPGRCYVKAGWTRLEARTKEDGLIVLQLLPVDMPEPVPPLGWQASLLDIAV